MHAVAFGYQRPRKPARHGSASTGPRFGIPPHPQPLSRVGERGADFSLTINFFTAPSLGGGFLRSHPCSCGAPQSMKTIKGFPSREGQEPSGPGVGCEIGNEPTPALHATPPRRGFSWENTLNDSQTKPPKDRSLPGDPSPQISRQAGLPFKTEGELNNSRIVGLDT